MKLATTTYDFQSFCPTLEERILHLHKAGFCYIDLSLELDEPLLWRDDWQDECKRLLELTEKLGMKFVQAHSPGNNPFGSKLDLLLTATPRSVEICGALGIPNTVVHSGWEKGLTRREYFDKNYAFYSKLFPAMERCGVNVLVENTTNANLAGYDHVMITGADMLDFLDQIKHPLLHAVWDTGHANVEGTQYEQIMTLGKELYAIHVHDNSGKGDEHLVPYCGTLNMDDLMNALIDVGYQGYFTFEAVGALPLPKSRYFCKHTFERDTRLLNPTLEMQDDMERLLFHVGEHALRAYGVYEE